MSTAGKKAKPAKVVLNVKDWLSNDGPSFAASSLEIFTTVQKKGTKVEVDSVASTPAPKSKKVKKRKNVSVEPQTKETSSAAYKATLSKTFVHDKRTLLNHADVMMNVTHAPAAVSKWDLGFDVNDIDKVFQQTYEDTEKKVKEELKAAKDNSQKKTQTKKVGQAKSATANTSASDWFNEMKKLTSAGTLLTEQTELWDAAEEAARLETESVPVSKRVKILPAPGYRARIDTGFNNATQYSDRLDFLMSVQNRRHGPKRFSDPDEGYIPVPTKYKMLVLPGTDDKVKAVRQYLDLLVDKEKSCRVKTKVLVIVQGSKLAKQVSQKLGQRIKVHQRTRSGMSFAGIQVWTKNTCCFYDTQPEWEAVEHAARFENGKANVCVVSDTKVETAFNYPHQFGIIIYFDVPYTGIPYDAYKMQLSSLLRGESSSFPNLTDGMSEEEIDKSGLRGQEIQRTNECLVLLMKSKGNQYSAGSFAKLVEEEGQHKVAKALREFSEQK